MFGLDGQVALITGASSGIGAATARVFAEAGADLVLATYPKDPHDAGPVADYASRTGREALVVEVDVRSREQVEGLVLAALRKFGHLDIVVANAAIARRAAIADMTEAEWDDLIDVDLAGVWIIRPDELIDQSLPAAWVREAALHPEFVHLDRLAVQ